MFTKTEFCAFRPLKTWQDRIINWRWSCCCDQTSGLTWKLWCDAGMAPCRWPTWRALCWSPQWPRNSLSLCSTSSSSSHTTSNPCYLRFRGKTDPHCSWEPPCQGLASQWRTQVFPSRSGPSSPTPELQLCKIVRLHSDPACPEQTH